MCRPTHYTIAYEINPWMSLKRPALHARALTQWAGLYRLLTRELGVGVRLLTPRRGVPDLVFTANAGLVIGRTFIRSNFRYPQRQAEEPIAAAYFKRSGFRVVTLPNRYDFEGEGDALWMGPTLVFGFRFRSAAPAHEELARLLKAEVLPVELADRRFYHLDTCFCPLDARTALWVPKAFDRYGRAVMERLVDDPIAVGESDAVRFACNAIVVPAPPARPSSEPGRAAGARGGPGGRSVVLQAGISAALRRQLVRRNFRTCEVELSEFLKAGGAAKCLILRLN